MCAVVAMTAVGMVMVAPAAAVHRSAAGARRRPPAVASQGWLTAADPTRLAVRFTPARVLATSRPTGVRIAIDLSRRYQRIVGFGAALTASSAQLLASLPAHAQSQSLDALFRPGLGAGIDVLRVVMGASDFAPKPYTYDDVAAGLTDPNLAHFSIGHDRAAILPILRRALAINPRLSIIASPWSAPAWMKTGHSLNGGSLLADDYAVYAQYFVRFIHAYAAAGVVVGAVSVQNEPEHAASDYPTMTMTPDQEARFVGNYLAPALDRAGLQTVKILGFDHNWSDPSYPDDLLRSTAARHIYGTAFHCYAGAPTAQTQVHDAFPTKVVWTTECSGGRWSPDFAVNLNWNSGTLLIGGLRNWSQAILYWNIALSPRGGPHDGGCADCRGVISVGSRGSVIRNVEFAELAQASSAVAPGAVRVASPDSVGGLQTVAFINPDGSRAIIINNGGAAGHAIVVSDGKSRMIRTAIPGRATVSLRWR